MLAQGDVGDFVYQLTSGKVEVFTTSSQKEIILGVVSAPDFLGEMGIIGGHQSRSASARASGDVSANLLEREEFLHMVSQDVSLAYRLIERLSDRVRTMNNRLIDSTGETVEAGAKITLLPATEMVEQHLPEEGMPIEQLPFTVGRLVETSDPTTGELRLPDSVPFRLSRQHFALSKIKDNYVVFDLDSTLGTEVNGEHLGKHFGKDYSQLKQGENVITAGGDLSPFVFKVVLT